MMLHKLTFRGELPQNFEKAFAELAPMLDFASGEDGITVTCFRADQMVAEKQNGVIRLGWEKPVQLYRAISVLKQHWDEENFAVRQKPCFDTGCMLDVSRNAVLRVDSVKAILRSMALMGMDIGMLYTEETFEVPEEPYFGYMRGRYSMAELKEIDDYADILGIEMIPCVQTLGHLERFLQWPTVKSKYADNDTVLLADSEDTYVLIRRILEAAVKPFRTKRIHIGMDEAHGIGTGAHLRRFGYEKAHSIIHRHLLRVKEMLDEMGLQPMMWSDMYFRPDSPNNTYYDSGEPSQTAIDSVVPGVELVYWDYYHNTEAEYQTMMDKHKKMTDNTLFAGGVWTWSGVAPDVTKMLATTVPALRMCKRNGVPLALATAWGDDGAETDRFLALPGLQVYAEFSYTGDHDEAVVAERFRVCCGEDWENIVRMDRFNRIPGMCLSDRDGFVNTAKFLLYQDPMVQLFTKDMEGVQAAAHYAALAAEYRAMTPKTGTFGRIQNFYGQLAQVLADKCYWHEHIADAVRKGDREAAVKLAEMLPSLIEKVQQFRNTWREMWHRHNKPYGFELHDIRIGGVCARLDTARTRVLAWAAGEHGEDLEELRQDVLHYNWREKDERWACVYLAEEIASACRT